VNPDQQAACVRTPRSVLFARWCHAAFMQMQQCPEKPGFTPAFCLGTPAFPGIWGT